MTEPIDGAEPTDPQPMDPQPAGPEPSARETARIRASELRTAQRKTDRRRRWLLRGGIALGIVLVVAVVTVVLVTVTRPSGRGPANMASDGIVLGRDEKAVRTPALEPGEDPIPTAGRSGVVAIRIWVDFFQPDSARFFEANDAQLRRYLDSGAATLEIHPIAIATTGTDGTQYSLRAANAAACVAEHSPDRFYAFTLALLKRQPPSTSTGLDAPTIERVARDARVADRAEVDSCIESQRFGRWVQAATARAASGPIADAKIKRVTATPTVLLNGAPYRYSDAGSAGDFARAFVGAVGGDFSDESTPTPTPSPSASATPSG